MQHTFWTLLTRCINMNRWTDRWTRWNQYTPLQFPWYSGYNHAIKKHNVNLVHKQQLPATYHACKFGGLAVYLNWVIVIQTRNEDDSQFSPYAAPFYSIQRHKIFPANFVIQYSITSGHMCKQAHLALMMSLTIIKVNVNLAHMQYHLKISHVTAILLGRQISTQSPLLIINLYCALDRHENMGQFGSQATASSSIPWFILQSLVEQHSISIVLLG